MMDAEEALLVGLPLDKLDEEVKNDILKDTLNGDYQSCVKKCLQKFHYLQKLKVFLTHDVTFNSQESEDFKVPETQEDLLCCAISALQLFVQINWTGPSIPGDFSYDLWGDEFINYNKALFASMEQDGESVYVGVKQLPLFVISYHIFRELFDLKSSLSTGWWLLRCISIYQQLLPERCPTLMKICEKCLIVIFDRYDDIKHESAKVQLNLEAGLISLFYYKYETANEYFLVATSLSGIECKLTGDLGVRTRFQQNPISQLRVEVTKTTNFSSPLSENKDIPKAMMLNHENLLEAVKFTGDIKENPELTCEQQAVLLAYCNHMSKIKPSLAMDKEEISAVVAVVLSNPKCWSVQTEALKIRSLLENDRPKTVERSMMQIEDLVNNIRKIKENHQPLESKKRLDLIYCVQNDSIWNIEKHLCKLYTSLGANSSALEVYMRLQMWEEAIVCLIVTGRGEEAKKLIHEQIKVNETPTLWCLLGDILMDTSAYEKAWEISNHKSSRAMRSLGAYYVSKKNYIKATECFEKSLVVNELQVGVCFNLGCAYMVLEDYKKAVRAFKRCTTLSWDNFQAWNNLSACFIHIGQKDKAYRTLQDAIKCQFDKWQVWENYIGVCVDTGHFQECIHAYNVLMDIKDKFIDVEILRVLVEVVTKKIASSNGAVDKRLKPKLLELFGKVTSKTPNEWKLWELYAKINGNGVAENEDNLVNSKALGYLQKSLKYATSSAWEKDPGHVKKVINVARSLCDAIQFALDNKVMDIETLKPIMASIRLNINGMVSTLRMHEKSLINETAIEDAKNIIEMAENEVKSRFANLWLTLK